MPDGDDHLLTLADGTQINMRTGRPVTRDGVAPGYVAIPSNTEAVREVTRVRRRLADLPELGARMNVVSAIAAYYMFGLEDFEIAHATGMTEGQVGRIRTTDAFTQIVDAITQNLVEGQAAGVRDMIEREAANAARNVVSLMSSDDEKVALVAAKDILDRAGHRPVDVVEHRHKVEGGLVIEYVSRGGNDDVPMIDMSVEDV